MHFLANKNVNWAVKISSYCLFDDFFSLKLRKKTLTLPLCFCCWSFFALLQYMEFGRSGHHGVYVHLHVVEAKEQEQGRAHLLSMEEGRVKDLKHIISLVILLCAQVSVFCIWWTLYLCPLYVVPGTRRKYYEYNLYSVTLENVSFGYYFLLKTGYFPLFYHMQWFIVVPWLSTKLTFLRFL